VDPTLQVGAQFVLHIGRKWVVIFLSRFAEKGFEIVRNEAIQRSRLGPVLAVIARRRNADWFGHSTLWSSRHANRT